MGLLDAVLHALGFMMPALVVALSITLAGRFFKQNRPLALSFIARAAIHFIVCLFVMGIGLILTGRDGKMVSYAAVLIASATVQWLLSGGWRK